MRRFFITQHPTFGSYANPINNRIEKSPYFYWWLALTLNDDYVDLCNNPSSKRFKTNELIQKTYKDFGDVRYEGDKYIAFTKWWIEKVNETETRGVYLFAEPQSVSKVMLVDDRDTATQLVDDESSLLIRVPKNIRRKQIDTAIEEKGAVVAQMRDDIVSMKITKGDLRGAPMKQLLGKDFEKVYPPKQK